MSDGLLQGFAQGMQSAFQGYNDQEDRNFKRKEMAARMAAEDTERKRKQNDQIIQLHSQGKTADFDETSGLLKPETIRNIENWSDPTKRFDDTEKRNTILTSLAKDGLTADFDSGGNAVNIRRDPRLPIAARGDSELRDLNKIMKQAAIDKIKNDNAEQYTKRMEDYTGINSALGNVEKEIGFSLDDYDDESGVVLERDASGQVLGKKKDLPGAHVFGLGKVNLSRKAQDLDTAIASVFNVELKDRSGAAVTDSELNRLRKEFADGNLNSEEQKLKALKAYKKRFMELVKTSEAGFDPEIVKMVSGRGGFTSGSIPKGLISDEEKGLLKKNAGLIKPKAPPKEKTAQRSPQDEAAVQWALANPRDPNARKILELNGVQVGAQ